MGGDNDSKADTGPPPRWIYTIATALIVAVAGGGIGAWSTVNVLVSQLADERRARTTADVGLLGQISTITADVAVLERYREDDRVRGEIRDQRVRQVEKELEKAR